MLRPFVLNEDEASAEAVTFPKAHIPEFVIISVNVDPVLRDGHFISRDHK
jgi:hypothetical protein